MNQKSALRFFWVLPIIFLAGGVFLFSKQAQTETCPLTVKKPYRLENSKSVYYISSDCKKRPIKNPKVYFSYFNSWDEVKEVSYKQLSLIPDHHLGFLPWGPRKYFKQGSVIKSPDNNKVYVILGNRLHQFLTENSFLGNGYRWEWIEDVSNEVILQYTKDDEIQDPNEKPENVVLKYDNSPEVFIIKKDNNGNEYEEYIKSMDDLEKLDYREDRIIVLPKKVAPTQRFYADPDKDEYGTAGDYIVVDQNATPPSGYINWISGHDNDNCPNIYNPDQKDTDGDGKGNVCDSDNSTNDNNVVTQRFYADPDKDGYGTAGDYIVVDQNATPPSGYMNWISGHDNDNCPNIYNPDQKDNDNDGKGDACDSANSTNDNTNNNNVVTQRFYADPDKDEYGTAGDYIVVDQNATPPSGYINWISGHDNDNCPNIYNPDQKDTDGDGKGNVCDSDNSTNDNNVVTQRFYADPDKDGYGTAGDYIVVDQNATPPSGYMNWISGHDNDNCPNIYNPDQKDNDNDGKGDACDSANSTNDNTNNNNVVTQRFYADPDKDEYGTAGDYIVVDQNATPPSGYMNWISGHDNDNCPNIYNPDQ